jgi:serine/threonine-protein kinase
LRETTMLTPGTRLGPYEVVRSLGAGGMGEVYRARDDRLKRDVAVKVLPPSFAHDPDRVRRFEQEAQAAGALNHPNILAIYDIGAHEGSPYIVSELLEGETLRECLARGPVPPRQAAELSRQIAEGLAAAHDKGVVHRDLKPENLFLAGGRAKILDFGLAKLVSTFEGDPEVRTDAPTVAAATRAGTVLGTVGYMSPEQVRGEAADQRSDIFSAGAVMYEMLTGRRAFGGGSPIETMSAILRDEPPELPGSVDAPPALERVVRRCLEKHPESRFQSARDLAFAITEASTGAATALREPLPAPRPWRRRLGFAVAVAALAGTAAFLAFVRPGWPGRTGAADATIRSLAVLPLENQSQDPDQEYFSDGMTEALTADLARVGGLRVISRTSAMSYKRAAKPLPQVARELGVDAVVEGSVLRSGDRVRITARLVDASADRHLWSNSYDGDLRDILALQSQVAKAIAREIRVTLTPQEEARFAAARPVSREAQESYLRGRYLLDRGTESSIRLAIDQFNKAIASDPVDARPHAGLADAYMALRLFYSRPRDVMPQAKAAAARAAQLDPLLAEAHVSMGAVLMSYEFDWAGAERELTRAIELSPNLASAHHFYALYLAGLGRHEEARASIERAMSLDPLALLTLGDAAWVHYLARRYDQTIDVSRKALTLDPNFWLAHTLLGLGLERVGKFPEAVASLERARELDSSPVVLEMLAGTYAAWGRKAEAERVLAELTDLATRQYVCPYEVATVHAGLGDKEKTMQWLEKGFEERADCMAWARFDAKLDALHGDARFQDLLRRLRMPE